MTNAIEIHGFTGSFGTVKAVDKINIAVRAGNPTIIRALLGMIKPNEGNIRVILLFPQLLNRPL